MASKSLDFSVLGDLIQAQHIATPIQGALTCATDDLAAEVVSKLRQEGFDTCPVVVDGNPIGTFDAVEVAGTVSVGSLFRPLSDSNVVRADRPLRFVGRSMQSESMLLVKNDNDQIEGLITRADFGKVPFRTFVYLQYAVLESSLADYLRKRYDDQTEAISLLGDSRQDKNRDLVADQIRDNLYIDHFAACSVDDLIVIAKKTLEYSSHRPDSIGWGRLREDVGKFRDNVMHSSRPLMNHGTTLEKIVAILDKIEILTKMTAMTSDHYESEATAVSDTNRF